MLRSILFIILFSNIAMAEPVLTGTLHKTNISGFLGNKREVIGSTSKYHAISSIVASENADKPCWLRLYKGSLNTQDNFLSNWFDQCGPSTNMKLVGYGEYSSIKVRGVRVCTNNKDNHRLKGIRLYGAKVNKNGTLTIQTGYDEFKRTNCKAWHKPVYCPSNMVATKLIVEYSGDGINGLGLKCKAVTSSSL